MAQKDLVVKMTINSKEFENGLQNAKKSVNSYESNIKSAAKAVGKLAAAYAAATAAVKTYASFAKQTQTWGDELANTLSACKTAWHTLQSEIVQGGSIAVGRMRELYAEAYKLSQLRDQMGTLQISQKLNKSLYLTPYNEARAEYQEAKSRGDKEGMRSAYSEMQRNLNEYEKESRNLINTSKNAAKQLLVAHGITLKEGQDIKDLVLEVRDAQNGNLRGITRTLQNLSKKTTTKMYSPTAGDVSVESGGLEWGKAKMRNMGYSDAQIADAERQLRMSEINDETYTEFANDILAAANALDEISMLRKATSRLVNGTSGAGGSGGSFSSSSGGGKGSNAQAAVTMTEDQIIEYWNKAMQNEILAADREKDAMIIDIELEDEDIVEPELDALIERVKQLNTEWQNHVQNMVLYSDAIGQFSNMFAELTNLAADGSPWQRFGAAIGGVLGEISKLMSTYASLIAIESVAESIKAGNGIPFPYNLIAIAAAGTALLGIISSLKGSFQDAGSFATGGIVGGNSYTGDRLIAHVNSGEMILNRSQQMALFGRHSDDVHFIIEGSQLRGVLDNYDKTANL